MPKPSDGLSRFNFRQSDGRYYLQAGMNSDGNEMGQAYLTASQFHTLFGPRKRRTAPKKLGCGIFACAYEQESGKVVKITSDASDAASMVKAQGSPYAPKLYAAYKLRNARPGREKPLYAMVVERLKTLSNVREMRRPFRCAFGGFSTQKLQFDSCCKHELPPLEIAQEKIRGPRHRACVKVLKGAAEAAAALRARGIQTNDVHVNNVGYGKDRVLKILDLGLSVTGSHNPETLAGGKSRKR